MKRPNIDSIKQRLMKLSKEKGVTFNSLLDGLFLERYLARVAASRFQENLIFKGGMCLAQLIKLGRQTQDLDFLITAVSGSVESVQGIFGEISMLDLDDGFEFRKTIVALLPGQHKSYPGCTVTVDGYLGNIQKRITIDLGIGDVVKTEPLSVQLIGAGAGVFDSEVVLEAYPPEYIFSEKYEAILHLGSINGRMKDFYDCYRLILDGDMDDKKLVEAIQATCTNRKTKPTPIPDHSDIHAVRWKSFTKVLKEDLPTMKEIISSINQKLSSLGI